MPGSECKPLPKAGARRDPGPLATHHGARGAVPLCAVHHVLAGLGCYQGAFRMWQLKVSISRSFPWLVRGLKPKPTLSSAACEKRSRLLA